MCSWNQDKMDGVKYIRKRRPAFYILLSLTFRLTNAKFSGSLRPGRSRRAPCSLISEQSEFVSFGSSAAALNFISQFRSAALHRIRFKFETCGFVLCMILNQRPNNDRKALSAVLISNTFSLNPLNFIFTWKINSRHHGPKFAKP